MFADEAVADYYRRYPNAPRHIAASTFDSIPFRSVNIRSLRRGAAVQGGGDVRGTPKSCQSRPRWHILCDQARDHCQSLRSRVTG
jgi:hypothetical protein